MSMDELYPTVEKVDVSLVRQLVFELVDSVVPVKCNNGCLHCIILKNTEFMIDILMKERDELLKHVQN